MTIVGDKAVEIILGVSITGIVSTLVFMLKWLDKLDLECHDQRRDISHLQRSGETISGAVADIDNENEKTAELSNRYYTAIERRFIRLESKVNFLHGQNHPVPRSDKSE